MFSIARARSGTANQRAGFIDVMRSEDAFITSVTAKNAALIRENARSNSTNDSTQKYDAVPDRRKGNDTVRLTMQYPNQHKT